MASPWPLNFSSGERPRALCALLFRWTGAIIVMPNGKLHVYCSQLRHKHVPQTSGDCFGIIFLFCIFMCLPWGDHHNKVCLLHRLYSYISMNFFSEIEFWLEIYWEFVAAITTVFFGCDFDYYARVYKLCVKP